MTLSRVKNGLALREALRVFGFGRSRGCCWSFECVCSGWVTVSAALSDQRANVNI